MWSRSFRNFSVRRSTLSLFSKSRVYKRYLKNKNKKATLMLFIRLMVAEKIKVFFKAAINFCRFGGNLVLEVIAQISIFSDYLMSFVEATGWPERNWFVSLNCVFCWISGLWSVVAKCTWSFNKTTDRGKKHQRKLWTWRCLFRWLKVKVHEELLFRNERKWDIAKKLSYYELHSESMTHKQVRRLHVNNPLK